MLCALDYGLAQGVDDAIIQLVRAGTIGAIACLPVSDLWPKSALGLQAFLKQAHKRPIVGLSLTLSGEFSPLSTGFTPDNREHQGYLPRLEDLARAARRFELDEAPLEAEFRAQFRRFTAHLGRKPDFLVLQTEILSFGPASRAVTATLAKFETKGLPVICPFLPLPTSFKDRLIKRYAWKANDQLREPWVRRAMMEVQEPGRLPPRSSWLQDGKVWSAIRPAFEDDRLKRFDKDPMMRVHQLSWL
ncbi:ChbG/HpnK family deacetylase [Cohaesibacter haloalkalitolerans]|uniref:ChbG/HpnK family deacetylase n=1 Tax=Cohaesibacter haloalkalitolerans TaxID=1162980 RepID=UPI000E648FCF|nr:ChbG/HpnK family deacetylase [Cohaesibacter haloalkalitolerans]